MKTVPRKLAAAIIVLGFATSASYAASVSTAASPQGSLEDVPVTMLAKKGADDPKPNPRPDDTGCDDHGTDICRATVKQV